MQKLPFSIVDARERSSCCLRSPYQPAKSASKSLNEGLVASLRRQEREMASRKPDAIPWPPTGVFVSAEEVK